MSRKMVGLAASVTLLGLLPGAPLAAAPVPHDASMGPAAQKRAGALLERAREALARGVPTDAVQRAEAAVAWSLRDAQARVVLGKAYLAAGRFEAAEAALRDAMTLDPALGRAAVARALAQIALGRPDAAQLSLAAAERDGADADIGLALALLGRTDEAIEKLRAAAREPGADARTRQNLALSYALAGQWNDAVAVAAQDVPAELIAGRLRRWATIAQLRNDPAMQVGALLGVVPVKDDGLPSQLALIVPQRSDMPVAPVRLAEAAPFALSPALPAILPAIQFDDHSHVTQTNPPAPSIEMLTASQTMAHFPEPALMRSTGNVVKVEAWVGPPRMRSRRKARIVEIKAPRPAASPLLVRSIHFEQRDTAPRLVKLGARPALKPLPAISASGWSVQLGAYSSAARTQLAWSRLHARVTFLKAHIPAGSKARRGKMLFHRLSVGGFSSRVEAASLCLKLRAAGGTCFVRRTSDDQPMTWAMQPKVGQSA